MANKYFENYPSAETIDPHGVDCVHPTTHKVLANYATYWQARDFCESICEENERKKRDYLAACKHRSDVIHANMTRPSDHQLKVPDMPEKPRLSAVPSLRWYENGKAPIEDTELSA